MSTKPHLEVVPPAAGPAPRQPLRELYEKYGSSVHSRCAYLLRDPSKAEDAMQEVFAKALQSYDSFRAESSPLTWLMKIATHHCLNILRAERAAWHQRFADQERRRAEPAPGRPQSFELSQEVRKLLGRFDLETQAAAIHYYVDEMTLEEVATLLGRSVPTVRKRLEEFAAVSARELGA